MIPEHEIHRTVSFVEDDPAHEHRRSTAAFERNRKKLVKEQKSCWLCGATDRLEAHHFLLEWMYETKADYEQLYARAQRMDIHGYAARLKLKPVTSVDDIRNLMLLCEPHHRGKGTGIHDLTWAAWIAQATTVKGFNPLTHA